MRSVKHRTIRRRQNKTKQNKTKQNKTKQNKTKQNKTKQNGGDKTVEIIYEAIIKSMIKFDIRVRENIAVTMIEYDKYVVLFACSKFRVDYTTNSLHIVQLSKCGELSGTKILQCIINIGRLLYVKKITLLDESNLNTKSKCEYSLANYYILLTGKSWYNSYGFISNTHDSNIADNENIRNKKLINFLVNKSDYDSIINVLRKEQYNIHDLTVSDSIQYLTRIMKAKSVSCNEAVFAIKRIVDVSERELMYNRNLELEL